MFDLLEHDDEKERLKALADKVWAARDMHAESKNIDRKFLWQHRRMLLTKKACEEILGYLGDK